MYRDQSKAEWATQMNMQVGITSVMNTSESTKFFNPAHPEVQTFLCDLLKDLAGYDLDGIFLDRGRFLNLQADFSEESRKQFEEYKILSGRCRRIYGGSRRRKRKARCSIYGPAESRQ